MIETQKAIYDFHKKHDFPYSQPLNGNKGFAKFSMKALCKATTLIAKICLYLAKKYKNDSATLEAFWRFHLITEETAEFMSGINNGDEIETCDGFGDLVYVVIGSAVSFRLPAKEITDEVCKSNETKSPRNKNTNIRLKDKGKDFRLPNFRKALINGKKRLTEEGQL